MSSSLSETNVHSDGPTERAPQSCRQCRRLKRKCPKDLPSCALCVRLGKKCQYPAGRKAYGSPQEDLEDMQFTSLSTPTSASEVSTFVAPAISNFPTAFFLDADLFQPISHDALRCTSEVPPYISDLLGPNMMAICESYFGSVDLWFPFVSRKKVRQDLEAGVSAELALLLLCMKLVSGPAVADNIHLSATELPTYQAARRFANALEVIIPTSMRLFQSLVLIALYEIGHGICPTAYLTISLAARLGLLRGVHDRNNATQLFQTPPTWTHWEEERRTWWATSILERYMNLGPTGFPLATPEPVQGELLPISDREWFRGSIGTSQPLYTTGFSTDSEIGPFARTCQASHILGRVLAHRNSRKDSVIQKETLDQALQLEATLGALDSHLSQATDGESAIVDLALCTVARLTLYHGYACIQPGARGERLPEESDMQNASIRGLKQIISTRGPMIATFVIQQAAIDINSLSPLVIQVLYDIATECQWFVREGDVADGADTTLQLAMEALILLSQRWTVAVQCLHLLNSSSGH
ncbi:Transcription factor BOA15 [Colletotrichum siamense]|uniref:Transcription factor BOA15 n=1 Tax=Colletotrichum siamense TaxID=690259 RepID=A0A9P5F1S2_COLSI|nr:Transcription factor BOA15 [Colletotrichum siamense]KAF4864582.1 Transcription factor BOA15 [Colletotrichum siamense]